MYSGIPYVKEALLLGINFWDQSFVDLAPWVIDIKLHGAADLHMMLLGCQRILFPFKKKKKKGK